MSKVYDLIIIGGGAAGFSALVKYNELTDGSKRIALINKGLIGGACVNVGCIPTKKLYYTARATFMLSKMLKDNKKTHINIGKVLEDIKRLVESIRRDKYEKVIERYDNLDLYIGEAYFKSENRIGIKGYGEEIIGDKIIIATGSRPKIPEIKGLDNIDYLTSDTIWREYEDIDSILIIGSGPVGLEIGQALSRLGVKTTIVEIMDRVIPRTEGEISRRLLSILSDEGIDVFLKSRVSGVEKYDGLIKARVVTPAGVKELKVHKILISTGRKPNTDMLMLTNAGIRIDMQGRIVVDKYLRTSNPMIYAAGDVSSSDKPAYLETISAREGMIAALNIVKGNIVEIDHSYMPVTIFTDPQLAYVGITEDDVIKIYGGCRCRLVEFRKLAISKIIGYRDGLAKLIADPYTGILRGFHVLAPNASEFISLAAIMLKHNYSIDKIIDLPSVFPSASEIIKLSAQAFIRDLDDMPCCVE